MVQSLWFAAEKHLHDLYLSLYDQFSEFELSTTVAFTLVLCVYVSASLPYAILDWLRIPFFEQYKIQKDTHVSAADVWKCIKTLVWNHFAIALPLMLVSFPALKMRGIEFDGPLPSLALVAFHVICNYFIEDFWFYWGHRWLHTQWAYRHVHSFHHQFNTPIGMCSSYAHPIEFIYLGIGSFLGPLLMGQHFFTILVWSVWRQFEAIECHCGYDFPWHLHNWFPLYCGPEHHDYHHFSFAGNYSSTFTYLDRILGTDATYLNFHRKGGHDGRLRRQLEREARKKTSGLPESDSQVSLDEANE